MKSYKIMILGAGNEQLPFIDFAKENNCEIVLVSPQGNYPGLSKVENIYYEDVKNKEQILEIAKKENIGAIVTDQIDVAIPTWGYVNDALNLNGIDYECALKFTNKYKMKEEAVKAGINVVPFAKVNNISDALLICANMKYPVIIKPIASSSSKGIYIISNQANLISFFPKTQEQSATTEVLIEKYINAEEFVVDGFVDNYQNYNLIIGNSHNFDISNVCISAYRIFKSIKSPLNALEKRILQIQDTLIKFFRPVMGNVHGEYLYDRVSDTIYLNEIAIRGGGCCITTHIVPYLTNINTQKILFSNIMGHKPTYNLDNAKEGYCAYMTCVLPEGEIYEISGLDNLAKIAEVKNCFISNKIIHHVSKGIKDKSSKIGPIILYSSDYENLMSVMHKVRSMVNIQVKDKDGHIQNALWS